MKLLTYITNKEILETVTEFSHYKYNIKHLEVLATNSDNCDNFRLVLESYNRLVRVSVCFNRAIDLYEMTLVFTDGETATKRVYEYGSLMTLINTLKINVPLYFKDMFPESLKITKEEYLNMLPPLEF